MSGALQSTGATLWYMYDNHVGPSGNQVALLRATEPYDPAEFTRRARAAPGGVWMFGNEPNTGGQDDITPDAFAQFVSWAVGFIRAADPTAILVGPGVLNWDATCTGCAGTRSGHSWSDDFITVYQQRYGPLPFNAWSLHAYTIDWGHLPMLDAEQDKAQLTATRTWLDAKGLNLPIWITEMGVIYGYDGLQWVRQNDGTAKAVPQGRFRSDLIAAYLDQMLDWLVRNGSTLRIDRWFLYGLTPVTEPWSTVPVGVALLEPNSSTTLSAFGQQYRNWALHPPTLPPPPPTATPRASPTATLAPSPVPPPVSSPTVIAYSAPAIVSTAVLTTPPLPTAVPAATAVLAASPTPLVARPLTFMPPSFPPPAGNTEAPASMAAPMTAPPLAAPMADAGGPRAPFYRGLVPAWNGDLSLLPDPTAGPRWASIFAPTVAAPDPGYVPDWWAGPCNRDLNGTWLVNGWRLSPDTAEYVTRVNVSQTGVWLVIWREDTNAVSFGACRGSTVELDSYDWDGNTNFQFSGYELGEILDATRDGNRVTAVRIGWITPATAGTTLWARP